MVEGGIHFERFPVVDIHIYTLSMLLWSRYWLICSGPRALSETKMKPCSHSTDGRFLVSWTRQIRLYCSLCPSELKLLLFSLFVSKEDMWCFCLLAGWTFVVQCENWLVTRNNWTGCDLNHSFCHWIINVFNPWCRKSDRDLKLDSQPSGYIYVYLVFMFF